MKISDIEKYLKTGSTNSICINRTLLEAYPGFVRDITILKENKLSIEFNTYGYDEGGLKIILSFKNTPQLIQSLEKFLEKPVSQWDNINKSGWYPDNPGEVDLDASGKALKNNLLNKSISLPNDWINYEIPPGYWKNVADGNVSF